MAFFFTIKQKNMEIIDRLGHLARKGSNIGTIFDNIVTIMMLGFHAKKDTIGDEMWKESWADFIRLNQVKEVNELIRELFLEYKRRIERDELADVLGDLYMDIRSKFKGSALGQYFTPFDLTDFMAKMLGTYTNESVQDPAVGSGRTLISAYVRGLPNTLGNYYHGVDLDHLCVKMCVFNLCVHGMFGEIWHSNSLSMPTSWYRRYRIVGALMENNHYFPQIIIDPAYTAPPRVKQTIELINLPSDKKLMSIELINVPEDNLLNSTPIHKKGVQKTLF